MDSIVITGSRRAGRTPIQITRPGFIGAENKAARIEFALTMIGLLRHSQIQQTLPARPQECRSSACPCHQQEEPDQGRRTARPHSGACQTSCHSQASRCRDDQDKKLYPKHGKQGRRVLFNWFCRCCQHRYEIVRIHFSPRINVANTFKPRCMPTLTADSEKPVRRVVSATDEPFSLTCCMSKRCRSGRRSNSTSTSRCAVPTSVSSAASPTHPVATR